MVTLARLLGIAGGFFFGIVLHEYAHARVADSLGDRYPRLQGRVTLNPKRHADPVGTLAMPGLFLIVSLVGQPFRMVFGYGKPIQYNPATMKSPKRDQILVALAGPAVNLALAAIGGVAGRMLFESGGPEPSSAVATLGLALLILMSVNVFMLVINVLPIPPLDGSRILGVFLSPSARMKMEEYGQYILLFLIVVFLFLPGVPGAMADPVCRALSGGPCPL